jgi:16S rRNA (cytosine967-C5)-methyltransferase
LTPAARLSAAIELLAAIESHPRKPADAVANAYFRDRRFIGGGDRRAVSERSWSVLRARRRLGWWLERARLPANPRLLAAASLLLQSWTLEGVVKSFSGGRYGPSSLDGAEQAALRGLEGHTLDHPEMPDAVRLEMPDWVLPHFQARFGMELDAEMAAMGEPAPLDLRVNLLKSSLVAAQAALAAEGLDAEPTKLSPWGLRIQGRRPVTAGGTFQTGQIEIQDEGSQLVAALVGAAPEMRVADWCAGAGGKTLALAMTMQNRGHISACDVSAFRLDGAVRRLRRAGVHNVERHLVAVGDKWAKRRAGSFDRVLVDAPCTGTGTWRRNPDARLRLAERDLHELLSKQAGILEQAARLVRSGGWLVYATCSLLPEENEAQVQGFLAAHREFAVVPLSRAWTLAAPVPCADPFLTLTPRRHGTDGFFAAVLERLPVALPDAAKPGAAEPGAAETEQVTGEAAA